MQIFALKRGIRHFNMRVAFVALGVELDESIEDMGVEQEA